METVRVEFHDGSGHVSFRSECAALCELADMHDEGRKHGQVWVREGGETWVACRPSPSFTVLHVLLHRERLPPG